MMLAQQLYEGIDLGKKEGTVGLNYVYENRFNANFRYCKSRSSKHLLKHEYGKEFIATKKAEKQSKKAQDAHEAIRPTSVMRTPDELKAILSRDQFRLYKLIWERFIASQMAPAVFDTVAVDLKNGEVVFRANGSQVKFPGFMKVYVEGSDDQTDEKDQTLPVLEVGDKVSALDH